MYLLRYPDKSTQRAIEKFISALPATDNNAILDAIEDLKKDPRPHKTLKLVPPVKLYHYLAHYRIRIGNYRVLYDINDDLKKIYILDVRKRNEQTYK